MDVQQQLLYPQRRAEWRIRLPTHHGDSERVNNCYLATGEFGIGNGRWVGHRDCHRLDRCYSASAAE
jgi:hypothetical protein